MDPLREEHAKMPPLGNLRVPRKNNTRAVKEVLSGNRLWDQRAVDRAARKKALRLEEQRRARPGATTMTKTQRGWFEKHLVRWSRVRNTDSWAPTWAPVGRVDDAVLDSFVRACQMPYARRAAITVSGLDDTHLETIRKQIPATVRLISLDRDGRRRMIR